MRLIRTTLGWGDFGPSNMGLKYDYVLYIRTQKMLSHEMRIAVHMKIYDPTNWIKGWYGWGQNHEIKSSQYSIHQYQNVIIHHHFIQISSKSSNHCHLYEWIFLYVCISYEWIYHHCIL